jgi:O-antigen/teichoic acid export membrane protein
VNTTTHERRKSTFAAWYSQVATAAGALVVIPVLSRALGQEYVAAWVLLQSIASIILLLDCGVAINTQRKIASLHGFQTESQAPLNQDALDKYLASALGANALSLLLGVVISAVISLNLDSIAALKIIPEPQRVPVWLNFAVASLGALVARLPTAYLEGAGKMRLARSYIGSQAIISASGVTITSIYTKSFFWVSFVYMSIALISATGLMYFANKNSPTPLRNRLIISSRSATQCIRESLSLGMLSVSSYLFSSVQIPIIGSFLAPEAVAPFYICQRCAQFVSQAVSNYVQPNAIYFTSLLASSQELQAARVMSSTLKTAVALGLAGLGAVTCSMPFLTETVFQTDRIPVMMLWIMYLDYLFLILSVSCAQFVIASGRNPFLVQSMGSGLANVTMICLLVPSLGILGIPLSSLMAGVLFSYRFSVQRGRELIAQLRQAT